MKTLGLITLILGLSHVGFAKERKEQASVRTTMHEILFRMQALRPYMVSKESFEDPKNEQKIAEQLTKLTQLVKTAKHDKLSKAPGLRMSKQVLQEHLDDTTRIFKIGNKDYARWSLNSTFTICMSCHTQAPSESRNWSLIGFTKFGSDFEHAEFLFAARDFDHALEKYDVLIDGYPGNKIRALELEKSIERKMAIFARVKRDFKGGLESVLRSQKNTELPQYVKKNLMAWEASFREAAKHSFPDPKTSNDEQIEKYVTQEMKKGLWDRMIQAADPRLTKNLIISGILYEYLNLHPETKIRPNILFWLAQCDQTLNNNFFYSLSNIYLKECMNHYPNHPVAKQCFKEYESNTLFSYSGSGGTHVPSEVQKELNNLRKKIYRETVQ
ncbi:MAG: hypothetical protein AB7F59_13395 [Bdellovibrionales bacterium]